MLNIFAPKKLTVHWWSTVPGLEKVVPVLKGSDAPLPDYWRSIPRFADAKDVVNDRGTVKNCPAIPDYFSQGYVVPLWTDVHFKCDENEWTTTVSDNRFSFSHHGDAQFKAYLPDRIRDSIKMVLKADCPWRVKTPDGFSMIQLPLYYHYDPLFEVLPGVIWTDIHHEINQQMIIKQYGEFFLKRGHPIAAYIPVRREELQTSIEGPNAVNEAWDVEARTHLTTKFRSGYRIHQSDLKRKCPFH